MSNAEYKDVDLRALIAAKPALENAIDKKLRILESNLLGIVNFKSKYNLEEWQCVAIQMSLVGTMITYLCSIVTAPDTLLESLFDNAKIMNTLIDDKKKEVFNGGCKL